MAQTIYSLEYRCKRCGKTSCDLTGGELLLQWFRCLMTGNELPRLPIGFDPPREQMHACKDGVGIAELIGLKRINDSAPGEIVFDWNKAKRKAEEERNGHADNQ